MNGIDEMLMIEIEYYSKNKRKLYLINSIHPNSDNPIPPCPINQYFRSNLFPCSKLILPLQAGCF